MSEAESFLLRLKTMDELEEHRLLAVEHTILQQDKRKVAYDKKLKTPTLQVGDLALVYDSRYMFFPGKLHTHWIGPYRVVEVWPNGSLTLETLAGIPLETRINGFRVKKYYLPSSDGL